MKIHMDKKVTQERTRLTQLLRLASATDCYEIHAWYELDKDEQKLLDANPTLKEAILFDYVYRELDLSPTVSQMINREDGGGRFVAYTSSEFKELEKKINEGAQNLKDHIESLDGIEGSSVTEI